MNGLEALAQREAVRIIQPPQEGTGDVWADIIAHLQPGALKTACEARRAFGIEKYGRPLRYGDGRGKVDQLQEALDLAAYAWRDGDTDRSLRALVEAGWVVGELTCP